MGRIIVPVDGSHRAEQAVGLAAHVATALDQALELLHVLPHAAQRARHAGDQDAARSYLESIADDLPQTLDVAVTVTDGDAASAILEVADGKPQSGTMIVMATHGRGGIERAIIGSVADRVARGADVPVVVTRETTRDAKPFQHLVVPLDGSPLAEGALPLALRLARKTGALVHLVRVIEPFWLSPATVVGPEVAYVAAAHAEEFEQQSVTDARGYLDRIARLYAMPGVRLTWEVRMGRTASEIVRVAETVGADLIVMSSHGRGGIRRLALGSVTDAVVREGTVPVAVVPSAVHQPVTEPAMPLSPAVPA